MGKKYRELRRQRNAQILRCLAGKHWYQPLVINSTWLGTKCQECGKEVLASADAFGDIVFDDPSYEP